MGNSTSTTLPWLEPGVPEAADTWFMAHPEHAMAMVMICGSQHWRGGVLWPRILTRFIANYEAGNLPTMVRCRDTIEFDATADTAIFKPFTEVFFVTGRDARGVRTAFPVERCSDVAKMREHFKTALPQLKPLRFLGERVRPDTPDITSAHMHALTGSVSHPFNAVIQLMVDASDLAGVALSPTPIWRRVPDARAFLFWVFNTALGGVLPQDMFLDGGAGGMFRTDPEMWACLALASLPLSQRRDVARDIMSQMRQPDATVARILRWLVGASLATMCNMLHMPDRRCLDAIDRPITPSASTWTQNHRMQGCHSLTMYAFMHRAFSLDAVATVDAACNLIEAIQYVPAPNGNNIAHVYVAPEGAAPPDDDDERRRKIPAVAVDGQ